MESYQVLQTTLTDYAIMYQKSVKLCPELGVNSTPKVHQKAVNSAQVTNEK